MIFSLTGNALAAELQLENQYADTAMVTLSDEIDLKITIIQKPQTRNSIADTSFIVEQYNYGELSRRVSLSADGQFLLGTVYENGVAVSEYEIKISERVSKNVTGSSSITPYATSAEYLIGYIVYNPVEGATTSEQLEVYCDPYKTDTESYTVNGKASDTLSDIAGIITSILVPIGLGAAGIAGIIAEVIVGFFAGKIVTGAIGTAFSEEVAVTAHYYNFRCYKIYAGIYSPTYPGVSRQVVTKHSDYYSQWFYEGITPETWKDNTLAVWCWNAIFAGMYPGVKDYIGDYRP